MFFLNKHTAIIWQIPMEIAENSTGSDYIAGKYDGIAGIIDLLCCSDETSNVSFRNIEGRQSCDSGFTVKTEGVLTSVLPVFL